MCSFWLQLTTYWHVGQGPRGSLGLYPHFLVDTSKTIFSRYWIVLIYRTTNWLAIGHQHQTSSALSHVVPPSGCNAAPTYYGIRPNKFIQKFITQAADSFDPSSSTRPRCRNPQYQERPDYRTISARPRTPRLASSVRATRAVVASYLPCMYSSPNKSPTSQEAHADCVSGYLQRRTLETSGLPVPRIIMYPRSSPIRRSLSRAPIKETHSNFESQSHLRVRLLTWP